MKNVSFTLVAAALAALSGCASPEGPEPSEVPGAATDAVEAADDAPGLDPQVAINSCATLRCGRTCAVLPNGRKYVCGTIRASESGPTLRCIDPERRNPACD
jgi:hypothetical protein